MFLKDSKDSRTLAMPESRTRAPVLLAFTDDDIRPASDLAASIKRTFDEHPGVDYIGGKILPEWQSKPPAWITNVPPGPLAIRDNGENLFYTNTKNPDCLAGANFAFRREAFERIGLFAPELQLVKDSMCSMEDHEIQLRLWRAGRQGLYDGRVTVTAEVQSERLKKDYHRKWHSRHGKLSAIIRLRELSLENGQVLDNEPHRVALFGIPAHIYRDLLSECKDWLTSLPHQKYEGATFTHELHIRYLVNYIRKRYEKDAAERRHSSLTEIWAFSKNLLRKKLKTESSKAPEPPA